MNNMDAENGADIIKEFQKNMNDSVIEEAVKRLPPEIYAINGATIAKKLKGRRDLLYKKGMKYYRFLSKEVNV